MSASALFSLSCCPAAPWISGQPTCYTRCCLSATARVSVSTFFSLSCRPVVLWLPGQPTCYLRCRLSAHCLCVCQSLFFLSLLLSLSGQLETDQHVSPRSVCLPSICHCLWVCRRLSVSASVFLPSPTVLPCPGRRLPAVARRAVFCSVLSCLYPVVNPSISLSASEL